MAEMIPASVSEQVIFPRSFIYQSVAKPVFTPATFTFFNLVEGDTGLRFQKTIIYQVSAEAESPETHVFWYEPWADPMRRKVSVANQPSYSWSNFTPTVTPPAVTAVEPGSFSGGVIFPRSFIYQSQTRSYFFTPETITVDKWFEWLSEPKRFKRGLKADEQQFIAYPPPFPNFIRTIGWFESLSEPKRFKKGLGAWLQQFFTTDQNKPVANPVFFSLNAVEINLDTALFGIAVGEEPVPVGAASASVTVVEIPAISGASASIQET